MITLNRRNFVGAIGAMGIGSLLGGCSQPASDAAQATAGPFFERIGKPIGLQLYALVGQDPVEDPAALFEQVRALGFGEMELPNLLGHEPAALREAAANAGIPITSLHVPAVAFDPRQDGLTFANPARVADTAQALGVSNIVIPFPMLPEGGARQEGEPFPDAMTRMFSAAGADHWKAMAETFNGLGETMRESGITLGYHNHNLEYAPLGDTNGWDILMSETDPELLKVQLDLGWVAQAGHDPVVELQKLSGRILSLHVKDIAADSGQSYYLGMSPTEIGSGTLDWPVILPAAQAAGAGHYYVEQEPPFTIPRPEAMAKSLAYLQGVIA